MPMHPYVVGDFLKKLADFGVEVMEIQLPLFDGRVVPTLTLIRDTPDGQRLMVPLGSLDQASPVPPEEVDSWCDRLMVQRIGYGVVEED